MSFRNIRWGSPSQPATATGGGSSSDSAPPAAWSTPSTLGNRSGSSSAPPRHHDSDAATDVIFAGGGRSSGGDGGEAVNAAAEPLTAAAHGYPTLLQVAVPVAAGAGLYLLWLHRQRLLAATGIAPANPNSSAAYPPYPSLSLSLSVSSPSQLAALTGDSSASACLRYVLRPLITRVKLSNPSSLSPSSLSRLHLLSSLTHLELSACHLPASPPLLADLKQLRALVLARNQLTSLPAEIGSLPLLEELDVSRNSLRVLPAEICQLSRLRVLNVMANQLERLPENIGQLKEVHRLGLKSNKLTSLPDSLGAMVGLVELFLTDNQLTHLPESMGNLKKLFKLQASFNALSSLPPSMGYLPALELMRVAVNRLPSVPTTFAHLDRLAWFSLAGNPACPSPSASRAVETVSLAELQVEGQALGDGASGDSFPCVFRGRSCVFKRFKAETSPDGHCRDEVAVACAVEHQHLVTVVALVEEPKGMVMPRVHAGSMAEKPSFDSLLRCRWHPSARFPLSSLLRTAHGLACALAYLHHRGICHGDIYAHNVLAAADGTAVLCDFGASFFYSKGSLPYEAYEVRAYGLLLNDMFRRLEDPEATLEFKWRETLSGIIDNCMHGTALQRLTFDEVAKQIAMLQRSVGT